MEQIPSLWTQDGNFSVESYRSFRKYYFPLPDQFVLDCVQFPHGEGPTDYQLEILAEVPKSRRVAFKGPHGLGKGATLSWLILWFALTRDRDYDWKIPTTASSKNQLHHYLWPEVHKWMSLLDWSKIGRPPFKDNEEMFTRSLRLRTGEAFAIVSTEAQMMEGAHADQLLYIFDESKIIPNDRWDSVEGAMSVGSTYWVAASTPGTPLGQFYMIMSGKPGYEDWRTISVTKEQQIQAGRMEESWAVQRARQWGSKSPLYLNRVEGKFASSAEDSVIPLDWVEEANERWADLQAEDALPNPIRLSADVAREGSNLSVYAYGTDRVVTDMVKIDKEDTMDTAGRIMAFLNRSKYHDAVVDVVGVGGGAYDRVAEQAPGRALPFQAKHRTEWRDSSGELTFADTRSAAWWNLRELLDPAGGYEIAIPDDEDLTADLTAPMWDTNSSGKVQVESKKEIAKRLGRSTDTGDAVVMLFWDPTEDEPDMEFF